MRHGVGGVGPACWAVVKLRSMELEAQLRGQAADVKKKLNSLIMSNNEGDSAGGSNTTEIGTNLKIWRNEFINLQELLPARLGIPEPTFLDVLTKTESAKSKKEIKTVQQGGRHALRLPGLDPGVGIVRKWVNCHKPNQKVGQCPELNKPPPPEPFCPPRSKGT